MKLITVSGPPSSGKTSVLQKTILHLTEQGKKAGVVKFDCLYTDDDIVYQRHNIPVKKGLSRELCPDHYFITNIEEAFEWGLGQGFDYLFTESAGLCNRCSPHIHGALAICVIDQLSGVHTPSKIGPMLRLADIVAVTKSDIVSQAEKEVFAVRVQYVNPNAAIFHVNGLNGQGTYELCRKMEEDALETAIKDERLRFPMPMALCSYCLGETRIGKEYQIGNVRKIQLGDDA
jgi:Ni2+-binding GTPase involved in maturation of urease and hydrogenase